MQYYTLLIRWRSTPMCSFIFTNRHATCWNYLCWRSFCVPP